MRELVPPTISVEAWAVRAYVVQKDRTSKWTFFLARGCSLHQGCGQEKHREFADPLV